jgi:hypothetical protein
MGQYLRHDWIDPSQKVAHRNAPFKVEQVEQLALNNGLVPHHETQIASTQGNIWRASTR